MILGVASTRQTGASVPFGGLRGSMVLAALLIQHLLYVLQLLDRPLGDCTPRYATSRAGAT